MEPSNHVMRRDGGWGRWFPFWLFALNIASWILTALLFHQEQFLVLVLLPLIPLALYLVRTRGGKP